MTSAQLDQKWIEGAKVTIEILRSLSRFPGIGPEGQDLIAFARELPQTTIFKNWILLTRLLSIDQILRLRWN